MHVQGLDTHCGVIGSYNDTEGILFSLLQLLLHQMAELCMYRVSIHFGVIESYNDT